MASLRSFRVFDVIRGASFISLNLLELTYNYAYGNGMPQLAKYNLTGEVMSVRLTFGIILKYHKVSRQNKISQRSTHAI